MESLGLSGADQILHGVMRGVVESLQGLVEQETLAQSDKALS